ncbi:Tat-translocated enzyme [Mycolicibacterium mageritense DSM 44476 = CIP 104973]|uniref:Deferrochelatase n=1 Tax=Mycolicibacterium mageritense TaxID=53462 RepID=A0AAI8TPY9_MYCME|nr:iron uptake transporter deferrochelatase/peroxidase subunit [Mycolicibacterium mageritense]MCC9186716.1 iron uptake transporter deferrochelatase/peroxidase subunit [Mycolicibacterium mageritense]BBX31437.1 peroxidase [Mycolicibacterium mageritense]BDY26558.1 putative deferrochelatase/peroxidase EfeN [Mycolicibacterium mageritense]CDO25185.1 Tat-translocated enzyme [Mycolicibacterium mageritense DSM 44476 = CIP 104973]
MSSPTSDPAEAEQQASSGFSRRKLFGAAGVTAAVVGAASAGALAGRASAASTSNGLLQGPVPFRGERQAGIITEAQDRMHFCAFDVTTDNRDDVIALLKQWTQMAERMTRGEETEAGGAVDGNPYAPPSDTGEALGLPASQLTLTIGFGPSFFVKDGKDRFGIADKQPAELKNLPKFPNETMDPAKCGGDICVQACANDPQVAVHAIRNLARVGFGTVAVRYSQLGFGRTSSTTRDQATPRNLFGFKDGTANLKADQTDLLDKHVWVADGDGPAWLTGGSYLITRRIRMRIENWDRTTLLEQERVIGRQKGSGAPNGLNEEFDELDFDLTDDKGNPRIDVDAHVRLVSPEHLGGIEILRRGYNFTDGSDGFGHLDAGLFFIAFVRSPEKQFIPMLGEMSRKDAMNEYITHTGTAIFACPPGIREGDTSAYWGSTLFA